METERNLLVFELASRSEPKTAGWEAQMLPLCCAVSYLMTISIFFSHNLYKDIYSLQEWPTHDVPELEFFLSDTIDQNTLE